MEMRKTRSGRAPTRLQTFPSKPQTPPVSFKDEPWSKPNQETASSRRLSDSEDKPQKNARKKGQTPNNLSAQYFIFECYLCYKLRIYVFWKFFMTLLLLFNT